MEGQPRRGHEEDGLEAGRQVPVHHRQAVLVVEVGRRAEAADDEPGAPPARQVDRQALVGRDLDVREVRDAPAEEVDSLLEAEGERLVGPVVDPDDQSVEQRGRAAGDVEMPEVDRVEGARIDRDPLGLTR